MIERVSVSRREALRLFGAGTAGIAFLAACSPSESASKSSGTKEFHGAWPFQVPPKGHFNVVEGITDRIVADGPYIDLVVPPPAMYIWKEKRYEGVLAESWQLDAAAKTYTVKLKSGLKWSDGKPLTSKDMVTSWWLLRIMRNVGWNYISDVQATDEQTVVFTLNNPSTVFERYALRRQIYSDAVYGEWATKAQQLFGAGKDLASDEGAKLNTDFQAFHPENVVASGPFTFDAKSITSAQLTMVKNATGYAADKIDFDKVVLYNGETPDVTPLVLSKDVDFATHGFPPATVKEFTGKSIRILRPPVYSGAGLYINLGKLPEFKDVRVRQALAYALQRDQVGQVSLGDSGKPVRYMTGFSDLQVPDWMSEADIAQLQPYAHSEEKAVELLTAAGWKKDGGAWLKPDGKPATFDVSYHAEFADYSATGQNVAQQLAAFGFKATARGVTYAQFDVDLRKGDYQMGIQTWGASAHPNPHFAFVQPLFTFNYPVAANQGGRGIDFDLKQTTAAGPVDFKTLVDAAGAGLDEAAQKASVTRVALAFNELLPVIPLYERYGNNPALEGTRVAQWPADDDPVMFNGPYADNATVLLMLQGRLKAA
ncbi:ABC transporter substrate-binding protein [Actinomycetes bacterium KLBMP 9797]